VLSIGGYANETFAAGFVEVGPHQEPENSNGVTTPRFGWYGNAEMTVFPCSPLCVPIARERIGTMLQMSSSGSWLPRAYV
jgi:hypothetical protein